MFHLLYIYPLNTGIWLMPNPGTRIDGFVSFVDFGATVLNLAGVEIPEGIDGNPFLGKGIKTSELDA
jgi:arylsulfatase A-like enzyme